MSSDHIATTSREQRGSEDLHRHPNWADVKRTAAAGLQILQPTEDLTAVAD
jgi:hypothetical protein